MNRTRCQKVVFSHNPFKRVKCAENNTWGNCLITRKVIKEKF